MQLLVHLIKNTVRTAQMKRTDSDPFYVHGFWMSASMLPGADSGFCNRGCTMLLLKGGRILGTYYSRIFTKRRGVITSTYRGHNVGLVYYRLCFRGCVLVLYPPPLQPASVCCSYLFSMSFSMPLKLKAWRSAKMFLSCFLF